MKFFVSGTNSKTKQDGDWFVEAESESEAKQKVEAAGIVVASIKKYVPSPEQRAGDAVLGAGGLMIAIAVVFGVGLVMQGVSATGLNVLVFVVLFFQLVTGLAMTTRAKDIREGDATPRIFCVVGMWVFAALWLLLGACAMIYVFTLPTWRGIHNIPAIMGFAQAAIAGVVVTVAINITVRIAAVTSKNAGNDNTAHSEVSNNQVSRERK